MFSRKFYVTFYCLFGLIYFIGLFIPLMNNDSAHHAIIGLHMLLSGDYISLIDHGSDYLDKPHLLFWLSAISYHVFGITSVGFKFPSLLFSILGIYSTFRLGKLLYNKNTGRLAALILTSTYAFILSNNDVRMDAVLTACIIFSIWQLAEFSEKNRWQNLVLSSLGLALGFSTKGMIGAILPCLAIVIHLTYQRNWKILFSWKWIIGIILFFLFISPVLVCYYIQFDLHPEKIIRGNSGISGIKFILFSQNSERIAGTNFGSAGKNDPFFFIHTILWASLPWSILVFITLWKRIKQLIKKKFKYCHNMEVLTIGTIVLFLILVSFSGFKLPHYINVILPLMAILVAGFLVRTFRKNSLKYLRLTQMVVVGIMLVLIAILNIQVFPIQSPLIVIGIILMLFSYYFLQRSLEGIRKTIALSLIASVIVNFILNTNFYPQLLQYQAGNVLASRLNSKDNNTFYLTGFERSNSFDFYSERLTPDILLQENTNLPKDALIYTGEAGINELKRYAITFTQIDSAFDYRVSRAASIKFLNSTTRASILKKHYLIKISN
ncbi:MAG TPA: glycosyltransferase family 39 protein [Chryseolinea sp.]|nr:glycosyltransferase family 39 protein [Chryseolinea sp.]